MSINSGKYKEYKRNFILDEGKLRKISDIVKTHAGKLTDKTFIRYRVNREDDSFYETRDLAEILDDDNSPGRAINLLTIELHEDIENEDIERKTEPDRKKAFTNIIFDRLDKDSKIFFNIKHRDRDWCFLLADELDTQLCRVQKNKQLLISLHDIFIDLSVILGIEVIGTVLWEIYVKNDIQKFSNEQIKAMTIEDKTYNTLLFLNNKYNETELIFPISIICVLLVSFVMTFRPFSRLIKKIDQSVFYWGDMVAIYDKYEKRITQLKWVVGIGFIVSLLATFVGSMLIK